MDLKLGLPYVNRNAHPGYIFKFDSISDYISTLLCLPPLDSGKRQQDVDAVLPVRRFVKKYRFSLL